MYQNRKPDIKRLSIYFVDNIALLYKMPKLEKANKYRILQKVNQVICIMFPNRPPEIMIPAQAVL